MKVQTTPIDGLLIFEPRVFEDERGYFYESFNHQQFCEAVGHDVQFVQDNQSLSEKGILRGLHLQRPPYEQGKLVRVIKGAVLDVAVDLRKNSPTYGQHYSIELSEHNKFQFWIPPGFAHGFLTLTEDCIFVYKVTGYYNKESEDGIIWDDPDLSINWGVDTPIISAKDAAVGSFTDFESPF